MKTGIHSFQRSFFFFFLFFSLNLSNAFSDPNPEHCVTHYKNGWINWTAGTVSALGYAAPTENEERFHDLIPGAARTDANRNIIEILKRIHLNTSVSVQDHAAQNDVILAGIEKTARDAVIKRQYYTSALAVEMLIETSMLGGFLQLVLPEDIRQIPDISLENSPASAGPPAEPVHTGLIIDAKGLGFTPVLNPVIVSEQGHDVYSSTAISREFAVQKGVCKYLCSMDSALNDERVGSNPVIIKGLRKDGDKNSAIVINMADYHLLEKMSERHLFLKECRVIIVMDL